MAQYECLYVKSSNKFVIAKEVGWQWGPGELADTFKIEVEELSDAELQAKYDANIPKEVKEAMAKADAERKAMEEQMKNIELPK